MVNDRPLTGVNLDQTCQWKTNLPDKSDKYDQFTLPFSSIIFHKIQKYAKCQGRGKGGSKIFIQFLGVSNHFGKLTKKKFLKNFQILTKIDRHFWMPYLVTFLRFFTVFTMEDKGKKVFTYCLSFLEEIGMSSWTLSQTIDFHRKKAVYVMKVCLLFLQSCSSLLA